MIYDLVRSVLALIGTIIFAGVLAVSDWGRITGPTLADVRATLEETTIQDLVLANHILADQGILDGFGHVSVRHPTNPNRFLLARSIAPALVTAEDIMEYDLDGTPIDDRGRGSYLERYIHSEIYKLRADVMSVVHTHSPTVIPFGVTRNPMRAIQHMAGFLARGVPVFEIRAYAGMSNLLVSNSALGQALAENLSDKSVVLMRGHGDVVVGPSIQIAVYRAIYTEVNARLQAQAIGLGGPINYLEPEEGEMADETIRKVVMRPWELWKRKAMGDK